jgi:hypothetical protein
LAEGGDFGDLKRFLSEPRYPLLAIRATRQIIAKRAEADHGFQHLSIKKAFDPGFIPLLRDSSLVSVITMVELTKAYSPLASIHYDYLGIGLLAAGMHFLVGLPFVRLARLVKRYFTPGQQPLIIGSKQKQAAGNALL